MAIRRTERIGRSGEYLAASVLARHSDQVILVPHGGEADIIFDWDNILYKCQVKTKSKQDVDGRGWRFDLRRGSHTKNRYFEEGSLDIYALVNLEYNNMLFIPFSCDKSQFTIDDKTMKSVHPIKSLFDTMKIISKDRLRIDKKIKNKSS